MKDLCSCSRSLAATQPLLWYKASREYVCVLSNPGYTTQAEFPTPSPNGVHIFGSRQSTCFICVSFHTNIQLKKASPFFSMISQASWYCMRFFVSFHTNIQFKKASPFFSMISQASWYCMRFFVVSTGASKVFVNAVLANQTKATGALAQDWGDHAGIGSHKGSRFLNGSVDEVYVFTSALTPHEIKRLACACSAGGQQHFHGKHACWTTTESLFCLTDKAARASHSKRELPSTRTAANRFAILFGAVFRAFVPAAHFV